MPFDVKQHFSFSRLLNAIGDWSIAISAAPTLKLQEEPSASSDMTDPNMMTMMFLSSSIS